MTTVSHLNAVKPFSQCTPWLWSQNLCHVCPGDWHQCLIYMHIPARPFSKHFLFVYFIMKCLIILYSDESKATMKKKNVVFSHSCFLPGKHVVILLFPVNRVNQNQVIIFKLNYPETVTIT